MNDTPILEVRNLVKDFPAIRAVDDVSLQINSGEVVFIVGPSGSGKSTFLRCINQLELPTAGNLLFNGQPVAGHGKALDEFRANVGMVFQHFNLFPHLTIKKNITLAPVVTGRMSQSEADKTALELLERIGLPDKADAYPPQLSGGQKQRVAIIRAMAMKPQLLLFDEPTSALDPEMVGEVLALMKELAGNGMTMIVVTHEIAFACEVASRMIFMDHGRIEADAAPQDLIKNNSNPRITEFFNNVL